MGRWRGVLAGGCLFTITDKSHLVSRLRSNSVMPPIRLQSIHQSNTLKIWVCVYIFMHDSCLCAGGSHVQGGEVCEARCMSERWLSLPVSEERAIPKDTKRQKKKHVHGHIFLLFFIANTVTFSTQGKITVKFSVSAKKTRKLPFLASTISLVNKRFLPTLMTLTQVHIPRQSKRHESFMMTVDLIRCT